MSENQPPIKIVSIAMSKKKGTPKHPVMEAQVIVDRGLDGDAHAEPGHRQVSLLAWESIASARQNGLEVSFGDFAENIATTGIDWRKVSVGSRVQLGDSVLLEITQIGKTCYSRCAIYYRAGDCIMPTQGTFARVMRGGKIRCGDRVVIAHGP